MNYTLKNNDLCVQFSTLGGALTSIKDKEGTEYLWQGNPEYWSGQAPVLFPICGSLREDKGVTADGKEVNMPRHGIVRKEAFQLESLEEDSICFAIRSNEKMMTMYPYPFQLSIHYQLVESQILVTYMVKNEAADKMPFFIGGHPGFCCPLEEGESYEDYQVQFEKEEEGTVPTPVTETGLIDMEHRVPFLKGESTLSLNHSLFEKDGIILDQLKSKKVKLCHKKSGQGVQVEFTDFPYLVLWSSANKGSFLAIEPWTGLSTCSDEDDVLEHKRNVLFAEPGQSKELSYTISIINKG